MNACSEAPSDDEAAEAPARRSLFKAVGTVSGITLISRLLGLIRDVAMASVFGLGALADAFYVAWTVPNLFRRVAGEGALSSALLPVYVELRERLGKGAAGRLASALATRLALVLALVVVLAELALAALPSVAPGWGGQEALRLSALLLPYLWFICLAGLLSGVLQSEGDFARPAFISVLLNLTWIGALGVAAWFDLAAPNRLTALALALCCGGGLQLAVILRGAQRRKVPLRPTLKADPDLRRVWLLFIPMLIGAASEQFNILGDRLIAKAYVSDAGGVAALYYSMRLVQLPTALIGTALATVLFPAFARIRSQHGDASLRAALDRSMRLIVFATLPAAVGLCLLSTEIVTLLFERGAFGSEAADRTARCLEFYAASVVMISLNASQVRAYHARQDSVRPMWIGVFAVALNLALNLLLVGPLEEAGLALATSVSATFSFLLLAFGAGGLSLARLFTTAARCAACCAVMAAGCLATRAALGPEASDVIAVLVPIAVAVPCYVGAAYALRSPELAEALGRTRPGTPPPMSA